MSQLRQPAVAELFYPANPGRLRRMVREYLTAAPLFAEVTGKDAPKALIVPHAGYVYSGPVAGAAYARLRPWSSRLRRIVLLGPAHRTPLRGLALPEAAQFATPLGTVPVDGQAIALLRDLPQVRINAKAHALEHSLEVHLPFLQEVLEPGFTIVPLLAGDTSPAEVAAVLESLWDGEETLIVVSSDLSHYHDYETACQIDQETSRVIEALQFEALTPECACGCLPIQGLLLALRGRALRVVKLDLRNSADTAGNRDQVVGYGAYIAF